MREPSLLDQAYVNNFTSSNGEIWLTRQDSTFEPRYDSGELLLLCPFIYLTPFGWFLQGHWHHL